MKTDPEIIDRGRLQNRKSIRMRWYLALVAATTFVFITALGPGLFGSRPDQWYTSWQRVAFSTFCHQIQDRSFVINGVQMAVCSRCIGIYGSLWFGTLFFPLIIRYSARIFHFSKPVLVGSMLFIIIDVLGNIAGIWTDTNAFRFFTGLFPGFGAAWLLTGSLFAVTGRST